MSHKHLLVTAPEIYAKRFDDALKSSDVASDLKVTYLPMITTQRLDDLAEIDRFLEDISSFDFVAFCSRKAIECFAEYVSEQDIILPQSTGFCAIGRDNEALQLLNITPAFVASEPSPQGIIEWFEQHPEHRGKRIAVLAPIVEGLITPDTVPLFIEGLHRVGLDVREIGCYITRGVDVREDLLSVVDSLDGVAFSSGAEVEVFMRNIGVDSRDLNYLVFGPYTAKYAQKLGLRVDLVNRDFEDFGAFVENIKRYYKL